jgi:hypothetical protein
VDYAIVARMHSFYSQSLELTGICRSGNTTLRESHTRHGIAGKPPQPYGSTSYVVRRPPGREVPEVNPKLPARGQIASAQAARRCCFLGAPRTACLRPAAWRPSAALVLAAFFAEAFLATLSRARAEALACFDSDAYDAA